jgi:hypothetical protein
MIHFLESGAWTAASLSNVASLRTSVSLARLQVQIRIFEKKFGRRPASLQELVDKGVIAEIPKDPFGGGNFKYDGKNLIGIGQDLRWGSPNPARIANDDVVWQLDVMPWR